VAWVLGVAAVIIGVISFTKSKERSIVVALAVLLSLSVVAWGVLPQ